MSAHVFTCRIDSLAVYIRGSYKLGGMLLFSDAGQRRRPIVARAEMHFHPGDMGHRPIAFRNTLPFFSPRESDRRLIDSPVRPLVARNIIRSVKKSRSEKKVATYIFQKQ